MVVDFEANLSKFLLLYGDIIEDEEIECGDGYIRIRVLRFGNNLFWHQMKNGELIRVKLLNGELFTR